jgi:hypothetical protein
MRRKGESEDPPRHGTAPDRHLLSVVDGPDNGRQHGEPARQERGPQPEDGTDRGGARASGRTAWAAEAAVLAEGALHHVGPVTDLPGERAGGAAGSQEDLLLPRILPGGLLISVTGAALSGPSRRQAEHAALPTETSLAGADAAEVGHHRFDGSGPEGEPADPKPSLPTGMEAIGGGKGFPAGPPETWVGIWVPEEGGHVGVFVWPPHR